LHAGCELIHILLLLAFASAKWAGPPVQPTFIYIYKEKEEKMLLDRLPAQPNRAGLGFRAQSVLGHGVI